MLSAFANDPACFFWSRGFAANLKSRNFTDAHLMFYSRHIAASNEVANYSVFGAQFHTGIIQLGTLTKRNVHHGDKLAGFASFL